MPTLILLLPWRGARAHNVSFRGLLFSGHAAVAVENAALRLQLAAFQRQRRRPVLTSLDRLFWVCASCPDVIFDKGESRNPGEAATFVLQHPFRPSQPENARSRTGGRIKVIPRRM